MTAHIILGLAVLAARATITAAISGTASSSVPAPLSCSPWVLPLGTYEGTLNSNNVCVYSNVRFASPPIGDLRFAAPEYPPKGSQHPADTSPYPICVQMTTTPCLSSPGIPLVGDGPQSLPPKFGNETEDCLFLDAYVPVEAFSRNTTLPVVVWIYGGAYLFGSKNQYNSDTVPFYLGDGFVNTATETNRDDQTSIIFVTGNYRLGAFGWLAGSYMEQNAQPNAGLLDQQAVMKFVQDNIEGVKGDPDNVSIWGESAGASSILHHLTMPQNDSRSPLFKKAIVQSPAYQWLWEREGSLNTTFTDFAANVSACANCAKADIACLRSNDTTIEMLKTVNQNLFQEAACRGIMPVGPSVDGGKTATVNGVVPYLAPYALSQGKAVHLDTIAISHVDNEVPYSSNTTGFSFIPLPIRECPKNETRFQDFLTKFFQGDQYACIRSNISKQYPSSSFKDQVERAAAVIRDSSFTCNTRFIADQYIPNVSKKVYAMDYAVFAKLPGRNYATHGTDLVPAFVNKQTDYRKLLASLFGGGFVAEAGADVANRVLTKAVAPGMQAMFTSHAIWGDPNYNCHKKCGLFKKKCCYNWLPVNVSACPDKRSSSCIWNLLAPKAATLQENVWTNNTGPDLITKSDTCDFWMEVATNITKISNKDIDQLLEQQSILWMDLKQAALVREL